MAKKTKKTKKQNEKLAAAAGLEPTVNEDGVYHIDDVMGEPNRIAKAIAAAKKSINERLTNGKLKPHVLKKCADDLQLTLLDYCTFQEMKSMAVIHGWLTEAEAQTVYVLLGNQVEQYNVQPPEVKIVLCKLFAELIDKSMRLGSVGQLAKARGRSV